MKKITFLGFALVFLLIALFFTLIIYAFLTVKPTTQSINEDLAEYFSKIVYIPKGIPPPIQGFNETTYFWEMETPEKEIIGIRLKHNTAFTNDQDKIVLTLEKEDKGDPSIFNKVLPAVIADKQSLDAARDPQKANLSSNRESGFNSIKLSTLPSTGQTVQITWEFDKSKLSDDLRSKYGLLEKFPQPLLRFLYSLPHFILSLLA